MTVTIDQDDLPENRTLDYAINVVKGRNVIGICVRVHIVDGPSPRGVRGAFPRCLSTIRLNNEEHRYVPYDSSKR